MIVSFILRLKNILLGIENKTKIAYTKILAVKRRFKYYTASSISDIYGPEVFYKRPE